MTNTTKKTTPAEPTPGTTAPAAETVLGPALRPGQKPQKVTFAHHLRIQGHDFAPGDVATMSPDYARQLRANGYLARERG
ncbi:hypothetical protein ACFWRZ_08605 [Streptomyces rubiginosohelvolus]|uniref:hypothetical protein n=1 Tax=Streptomyces rubiginosohelvolus TaxID=67362 RepID=UPI00366995CB